MKREELKDPYYQKEAKRIIDIMFDGALFNPKMSRDDLQAVEDLLAYYMDSHADSARRAAEIMLKVKKN